MTKKLEATYDSVSWDEKDVTPLEGSTIRIKRTRTERTFKGALNGVGVAEYIFIYHDVAPPKTSEDEQKSGPVTYNGYQYFKGTVEGYEGEGEFVVAAEGTWGLNNVMKAIGEWTVVPEAGKGAFKGLKGKGGYESTEMKNTPCWIQFEN